jgi:two-component system response regulator HydG
MPLLREDSHQRIATPRRVTLLTVGDDPSTLDTAERFARDLGFDVVRRGSAPDALLETRTLRPDAVLVDLQGPTAGLDTLRAIRDVDSSCRVLLVTGRIDAEATTEALRHGALACLARPPHADRLRDSLTMVAAGIEQRETLLAHDARAARQFEFQGIVGRSAAVQELVEGLRRFGPHFRVALITGEPGTGKELAARALHALGSGRERRFVAAGCSAGDDTLVESELFGHQRGAFAGAIEATAGVFEQADGGTLFLEEVAAVPRGLQPKLLRAMVTGEAQRIGSKDGQHFDVRVVAASSRDLRTEVAAGRFRRDLYERLHAVHFAIPPLRQRREDIPLLTAAFVEDDRARTERAISGLTIAAERTLQQAHWAGNVRELKGVIERACSTSGSRLLGEREILAAMGASADSAGAVAARNAEQPDLLSSAQRRQIENVLQRVGGNKTEAARLLGISRRALYRWLERLGLAPRK